MENEPERFESMTPFTSDSYRTLRVFFTNLHPVETIS
jgi:hypothetical protein